MKPLIRVLLAPLTVLALTSCGAGPDPSAAPTAPSGSASATYRMADVAKHNTGQDCWAAVDGGVYDLTSWISRHPGGPDKIVALCGTDATVAFHNQHDGQEKPNTQLATFRVGALLD